MTKHTQSVSVVGGLYGKSNVAVKMLDGKSFTFDISHDPFNFKNEMETTIATAIDAALDAEAAPK